MEAVHAELVRLATELEAVKGQVQTECNALRDLFARTNTVMSSSGPQHYRRLNHREAGRHLPQQFGGSRLDYGDVAFRMEGYAAVLSRDGQGGALLREDAKLDNFEDNTVAILERSFRDVQQLSAALAAALISCTRGEVAMLVRRILSVSPGDGLQAWHAVTQWFKPRSVVEQAASMTRLMSPKSTKNVNELEVAVMQWELTLVEHESKFSERVADSVKTAAMRAMLPKDMLERLLDGPFHYEELRSRVSAFVGEKLAGQDASSGAQPMDIGQVDKSKGEDDDVNAVQQRRPYDLSNQKHKQESDNERKPFNRPTANSSPSASRQSTPRDKKSWSDETKQSAGNKKRLICNMCCGKGYPARL